MAWPPSPPAWPQQSAPPTWPPLPDTGAGNEVAPAAGAPGEGIAAGHEVAPAASDSSNPSGPPVAQQAEPASEAPVWAPATEAAAGVYARPGPPWPNPSWPNPSWSPSPAGAAATAPAAGGWGSPGDSNLSGSGLPGGSLPLPLGAPGGRRVGRRAIALGAVIALVVFSVVGVVIGTRSHGRPSGRSAASFGPGPGASRGTAPSGSTSSGSTSGSTSSGSASGPAGAVPLGDGQSLIGRIVPAPAGAHSYNVEDSSGGIMTVKQYVQHYFNGATSELNRLQEEGFRVAASTDYVRSDGIEIATHLVQFTDTTGAQEYFDVERSAWPSEGGVTMFSVPARPDAVGYELAKVDSLGNRRTVMYEHIGNVVVVVNVYTPGKIDQAEDVKVLQAQLALLG